MRLNIILFTIVLGFMVSGAVFFVFIYPINLPESSLGIENLNKEEPLNSGQAFLLPVAEGDNSPVRDFNIEDPVIEAKSAALYDVSSKKFLYVKNVNKRLPIASITKLMTAVVIVENLDLTRVYTVPAEAVNVDGFGADLYRGEKISGLDLLKIMLIKSSNDAAMTFMVEGRKQDIDLVIKMNEKAEQLGMTSTYFLDTAGLDDSGAFSTAADLIKLVHYASNYDMLVNVLATPVADVSSIGGLIKHQVVNTNQLLGRIDGIIFGKTGFTDDALGTMVMQLAVDGGNEKMISVILGSNDRFGEMGKLINWGRQAYSWQ
ncbi:MAG: hypothetical protein AAB784_02660 [Patescibacteria group bacterium]